MTRGIMGRVVLAVWLGCLTAAAAQLPPEVLVDKYLLQAQLLSEEKDYKGALEAMDRIVALQKEHGLTLPEEFSFHYAQTALSAGEIQAAIDSVNGYLSVAGRKAKYYRGALALLVEAERRLLQPAVDRARTGQAEPEIEPQPQAVEPSPSQSQEMAEGKPVVDCGQWNSSEYFKEATLESVTTCLAAGADPQARTTGLESTPLHFAAWYNDDPAVIEVLLKAGADPMALDNNKDTPLHCAARFNRNPAVSEALLKAGADPIARNEWKHTPLQLAGGLNNDAVRTILLAPDAGQVDQEIEPQSQTVTPSATQSQRTTKEQAVVNCENWNTDKFFSSRSTKKFNRCLEAGADPMARNYLGSTPLHFVADRSRYRMTKRLLDAGASVDARDVMGQTPLHKPNWGDSVVKALLKAGADPMARDNAGRTPLHMAIDEDAVKALVKAGADPMARDYAGRTPLHMVKYFWVIKALVKAGADPMARDNAGRTPLHMATDEGEVKALLKAGADPMARDYAGRTPLHMSTDEDAVKALVNAGADPMVRDNAGRTPLDLAKENENQAVSKVLLAAGAGRRERKKSQSDGGGWAALVAGVTGAAIGVAGGLDAATATELGASIGGSVLAGEAGGNTVGGSSSTPTGSEGSSSEFDTALSNLENSCGERYRSGFSDQDHGRFYCLDAFARHCALKKGHNQQQLEALRHDFEVLQSQGQESRCPYFGILGGTYNENQPIPQVSGSVTEERPTVPVTQKRRLPTCADGQEVPIAVAEGRKPGCPPESWCRWDDCRNDECRRRYPKCEPGVLQ